MPFWDWAVSLFPNPSVLKLTLLLTVNFPAHIATTFMFMYPHTLKLTPNPQPCQPLPPPYRMIATSNPLPEVIRAQVVARLQTTLSSLLSCAAVVWTAHWNTRGIDYEGTHKRYGKIVENTHAAVDSVAEMMRQLGGEPVVTAATGQLVQGGSYGTLVIGALARLLTGLRSDVAALSVDLVAQNLLIEIATTMQKHLWVVEAGQGQQR